MSSSESVSYTHLKDEVKKSKQYDSCSNTCMYNDCYTGTC